jgi:hypothetical protein
VAVELTPNGREWSVIGEYGAVGAGGERGSASTHLPGRKLASSKSPRVLKPDEELPAGISTTGHSRPTRLSGANL